uniref:Uncharacterized protein n=1 Tax=Rhizophora mucronata TaxID=61149 RepID=A0A2P2PWK6_RHIMU
MHEHVNIYIARHTKISGSTAELLTNVLCVIGNFHF